MLANKTGFYLTTALTFGIINWLAWPAAGFSPLLLVSWFPILLLENNFFKNPQTKSGKLFGYLFLSFFSWNILTTWWIYYSTFFGAAMAIGLNSLFMAMVFMLWHIFHKTFKSDWSYVALPVLWISFEYLHLDWDLSWPWLTLGNGFAAYTKLIQWYEYTGVFGGSLWILTSNILLFLIVRNTKYYQSINRRLAIVWALIIAIPLTVSIIIYNSYKENESPVKVAIVQPNIDPYNEKFSGLSVNEQLDRIMQLAKGVTDSSTLYLIAPETAIPSGVWENELNEDESVAQLRNFISHYPGLTLIIGASTYKYYGSDSLASETARFNKNRGYYYDSYNTAFEMLDTGFINTHHKSKLVPGVEMMPFPKLMMPLQEFAFDLGGMVGSLGTQIIPSVFINRFSKREKVAPIICYESIYGEYVSQYVQQGANMLAIITNDGWWDDSPGYRQHFEYGRLRAIEMRRSIARSANTGISAIINQRGDVFNKTAWWVDDAFSGIINLNEELTFYAKYGDYIARISLLAATVSIILLFIKFLKRRFL